MVTGARVVNAEPRTSGEVPHQRLLETSAPILALGSYPKLEIEHTIFLGGWNHGNWYSY